MTDLNLFEPRTGDDALADANSAAFAALFADLRAAATANGRTTGDVASLLGVAEEVAGAALEGSIDLTRSDVEQLAIAAGARLVLRGFVPDVSQPAALGHGDTTEAMAAISHVEVLLWARFWEAHDRGDRDEERRWFGALCRCDDVRIVLGE